MAFGQALKAVALLGLLIVAVGTAGCHASFCAGSGCSAGHIDFGTNYKMAGQHGDISIIGKRSTFRVGENIGLVAHLSSAAGTKALRLQVTWHGSAHQLTITIANPKSNVVGAVLAPANLSVLGISQPGRYTFRMLHGTKQLAGGSLTEK